MNLLRRLSFNIWYFGRPPWDTGISPPELLGYIDSHPPGRALDLGCGTGTNVITLAQHGWAVVGIDFALPAIRIARRKAQQAGLQAQFYTRDVTRLENIPAPFDLILDIGCFHGLSSISRQTYVNNLRRYLAPQGDLLIYAFLNPDNRADALGLSSTDLEAFNQHFLMIERRDGTERNRHPSAWFTFQNNPIPMKA